MFMWFIQIGSVCVGTKRKLNESQTGSSAVATTLSANTTFANQSKPQGQFFNTFYSLDEFFFSDFIDYMYVILQCRFNSFCETTYEIKILVGVPILGYVISLPLYLHLKKKHTHTFINCFCSIFNRRTRQEWGPKYC